MVNDLMRQYILRTYVLVCVCVCVCVFIKHTHAVTFSPFPLSITNVEEMIHLLLIPAVECCLIGHELLLIIFITD